MNWKVILILLLVTLGLGGYLLFQQETTPDVADDDTPRIEHILPYAFEDVNRVTVIYNDTTYVAERNGFEWKMLEPDFTDEADTLVINHLVRVLCEAPFVNSIPVDSLDLSSVKLDIPVLVFTAYTTSGDSTRLEFGTLNPTTDNIYVHRAGEGRVVLANKLIGPMMTVSRFLLLGKSLTGVRPFQATSIEVESGGRKVFGAWRSNDRWWIADGGDSLWADQYKLEVRLGELYRGQVREWVDAGNAPSSQTGLANPLRVLKVGGENGEIAVVKFGAADNEDDYLRWASSTVYPDQVLKIDAWLIERIDMLRTDSMQCRQVADFFPPDVDMISVSSPLDSLVLTAENDTLWNIIYPQQSSARYLAVDNLLIHADTLAGSTIVKPGQDRGYNTPQARLVLMQGEKLLADVVFGNFAGEDIYVRDNTRNMEFLASSRDLEPLNVTFKALADVPVRHVVE